MKALIINNYSEEWRVERLYREVGKLSKADLVKYSSLVYTDWRDYDVIILSGSQADLVQGRNLVRFRRELELVREAEVPVLGICYGLQLIAFKLGGRVSKGRKREYGRAELIVKDFSDLFSGLPGRFYCWMSHADKVTKLPKGFEAIAYTKNSRYAAVRDKVRKIYGVQFHPEVTHTEHGRDIIENFAVRICGCRREWNAGSFIERAVKEMREKVGEDRVLCALSGGVDSTTTAVLVKRAIGDRLFGIFVNHGLMREGEPEEVIKMLKGLGINFRYVDASERFLEKLKGVADAQRTARYHCVIVYMLHANDPMPLICQGSWEGRILHESRGEHGFGYDPFFYVPTHDCTSAELLPAVKNDLSHRGLALRALQAALSANLS